MKVIITNNGPSQDYTLTRTIRIHHHSYEVVGDSQLPLFSMDNAYSSEVGRWRGRDNSYNRL